MAKSRHDMSCHLLAFCQSDTQIQTDQNKSSTWPITGQLLIFNKPVVWCQKRRKKKRETAQHSPIFFSGIFIQQKTDL